MGIFDALNAPANGGLFGAVEDYRPPSRMSVLAAGMQDLAMNMQGQQGNALDNVQNRDYLERQNAQERERLKRRESIEQEELRIKKAKVDRGSLSDQISRGIWAGMGGYGGGGDYPAPAQPTMSPAPGNMESQGGHEFSDGLSIDQWGNPLTAPVDAGGVIPSKADGTIDAEAAEAAGYIPFPLEGGTSWAPPGSTPETVARIQAAGQAPDVAPAQVPVPAPAQAPSVPMQAYSQEDATAFREAAGRARAVGDKATAKTLYGLAEKAEDQMMEVQKHNRVMSQGSTELIKLQNERDRQPRGSQRWNEIHNAILKKTAGGRGGSSLVMGADGQLVPGGGDGGLTTATQSKVQQELLKSASQIGELDMIRQEVTPEMFQMGPKARVQMGNIMQKMGSGNLTDADLNSMLEHAEGGAAIANYVSTVRNQLYGSALTRQEIQEALKNLPDMGENFWQGDSYSKFMGKMSMLERKANLGHARKLLAMENPDLSQLPLSETGLRHQVNAMGAKMEAEAVAGGADPATARQQVARELRAKYGQYLAPEKQ